MNDNDCMCEGKCSDKQQGDVYSEISRLENKINLCAEALNTLNCSLKPVLYPSTPSPCIEGKKEKNRMIVPLAKKLKSITAQVINLYDRMCLTQSNISI